LERKNVKLSTGYLIEYEISVKMSHVLNIHQLYCECHNVNKKKILDMR
jgi:hypothetical protein